MVNVLESTLEWTYGEVIVNSGIWNRVPLSPPQASGLGAMPSGETQTLAGDEVEGPNSDEGTETLVLFVYCNPFPMYPCSTISLIKNSCTYENYLSFRNVIYIRNLCIFISDERVIMFT
jgi:hypothetical protein